MNNENKQAIQIEVRRIEVKEYQLLRAQTNWNPIEDTTAQTALENDLYSVIVLDDNKPVAMGRVIGDGAIYFYVQDIIVHTAYRDMGIGNLVMEHIEYFLEGAAQPNSFIGLMAAKGTQKFYRRFGYKERESESPGMFKILKG
nr:GNAT family N-acetyltransferase [Allomuricauda sp.]